jgi:E3 ubiquitin-protein ligase TRIP12
VIFLFLLLGNILSAIYNHSMPPLHHTGTVEAIATNPSKHQQQQHFHINHQLHHHPAHHHNELLNFSSDHQSDTNRSQSPAQMKMSDILKRKVPPKRKSSSGRSKPKDDGASATTTIAATSALQSQSVMQELINKATTLGSSSGGRNTPSSTTGTSSRSRFSGASAKTSSFLASLNPARWGRTSGSSHNSSANSGAFTKDGTANSLCKSTSNSNLIAAGNREKARQWIRDQAISFIQRYIEEESAGQQPHPAISILARLTGATQKMDGTANECLQALKELRNILIESDISPFEVNHSGLIKSMLNFMSNEHGSIVPREDRLRAFLHVFAGLSLEAK